MNKPYPTISKREMNTTQSNPVAKQHLFTSDEVLFTNPASKPTVTNFAKNQSNVRAAFITAMRRLGRVGVKTGKAGEMKMIHCNSGCTWDQNRCFFTGHLACTREVQNPAADRHDSNQATISTIRESATKVPEKASNTCLSSNVQNSLNRTVTVSTDFGKPWVS
ncbi:Uncharacterized protein TCM_017231 [Theobroma cacao]|uniref:peroxidase n=1 Tax=Theobroma cacao TaxID=3641 RepID=A0A061EDX0_THECC|nr:Uncharacterized protein TCM_017231 [Theobroma cacao]